MADHRQLLDAEALRELLGVGGQQVKAVMDIGL
jgi:hypothetical protein